MNGFDYGFRHQLPLKERMERIILHRREKEQQRQETWENASKYFSTWGTKVAKHNEWTSGKYYEDSLNSWEQRQRKEQYEKNLKNRKAKLKKLLEGEKLIYDTELRAIDSEFHTIVKFQGKSHSEVDSSQKLELLRLHAVDLRNKKEEERKKEVAAKEFLRWRATNPVIRDIESRYHAQFVRKVWDDQLKEKEERDRIAKENNARIEEDLRAFQEEEVKRIEDQEAEKKRELDLWKDEIRKQREELKLREEISDKLNRQLDEIEKQQLLLNETVEARERLASEREKKKALAKFWEKQTRMKIRAMINDRVQAIADDNRMLEYLKHLEEKRVEDRLNANQNVVSTKINAARQCLEEQRKKEMQREKDAAALFEEEARAFLRLQEILWEKERQMRETLMQEVILTVQKQIEEKRRNNIKRRETLDAERGHILYEIEERAKRITDEESKARQALNEMKSGLTHQVYEKRKQKEKEMLESLDTLGRLKFEENERKRREEAEANKIKLNGFQPKFHGLKKLAW